MTNPASLPFTVSTEPVLSPRSVALAKARSRTPDPVRSARGKRNRRAGSRAQTEWAQRIGGRNVGILGDADVIGPDSTLWEVKAVAKPTMSFILAALEQVERHATLAGRDYGLALRLPDRPANKRWLVIRWG